MANAKPQLIPRLILWAVVGLSIFTHFFNVGNTYIFQNDEARDVLIALKMIQSAQPVLLGPETSVGNMYLGPFYYYLMVPFLYLFRLDPIGPALMVALFGTLTTIFLYQLGKKHFGYWSGIVAALFASVSPLLLHHSRSSWNPNVIPFFVTLLLLLPNLKRIRWQLAFGMLTGILFQLHYVALILPAIMWLKNIYPELRERNYLPLIKSTCLVGLGFIITSSPFWLFEFRHQFVNSNAFITYLTEKTVSSTVYPSYSSRLLSNFRLLINGVIFSSSLTTPVLPLMMWIGIGLFVLTLILVPNFASLYMLVSLIILSILKETINVHYLAFLFPLVSLWFGSLVQQARPIRIIVLILGIYLLQHFYPSLHYAFSLRENAPVIRARATADYIVTQAAGRPYNVVGADGAITNSIAYFLAISNNTPSNELQELVFDICTGGPCKSDEETTVLLFLTGPSHPSLIEYLGHPAINEFTIPRQIIKNEWVSYDNYVATIKLQP